MSQINKLHKKCLYALLSTLKDYLDRNQIFYFIDGGTLLGAIREGEIIEHDDDIDLGILEEDFYKLEPILDELDGQEIYIEEYTFDIHIQIINKILKIYLPQFSNLFKSELGNPCIDIFYWTVEDGKFQLLPKEFREQFPNCYYEYDEMFPRFNYNLGDVEVKGAQKPLPYLLRYYGEDCLEIKKKYIRDNKGFKNEFVIVE